MCKAFQKAWPRSGSLVQLPLQENNCCFFPVCFPPDHLQKPRRLDPTGVYHLPVGVGWEPGCCPAGRGQGAGSGSGTDTNFTELPVKKPRSFLLPA